MNIIEEIKGKNEYLKDTKLFTSSGAECTC
jgi:hypothetical protein